MNHFCNKNENDSTTTQTPPTTMTTEDTNKSQQPSVICSNNNHICSGGGGGVVVSHTRSLSSSSESSSAASSFVSQESSSSSSSSSTSLCSNSKDDGNEDFLFKIRNSNNNNNIIHENSVTTTKTTGLYNNDKNRNHTVQPNSVVSEECMGCDDRNNNSNKNSNELPSDPYISTDEQNSHQYNNQQQQQDHFHDENHLTLVTTPPVSSVPSTSSSPPTMEQERQIILLMLLGQVCALHDPTPRTFTIHVLELFERGIVDRQAINFLYVLGLVPQSSSLLLPSTTTNFTTSAANTTATTSQSATQQLHKTQQPQTKYSKITTTTKTATINTEKRSHDDNDVKSDNNTTNTSYQKSLVTSPQHEVQSTPTTRQTTEAAAVTTTTTTTVVATNYKELLRQRSIEASAIRTTLELQEQQAILNEINNNQKKKRSSASIEKTRKDKGKPDSSTTEQMQKQQQETRFESKSTSSNPNVSSSSTALPHSTLPTLRPWSVQEHPLSLSRYQREFQQVRLLNSGSFGYVYQALNYMDQQLYAIKCITFIENGYHQHSLRTILREVHCLASCQEHPNVVRYYTSWFEPSWMTGAATTTTTANTTTTSTSSNSGSNSNSNNRRNKATGGHNPNTLLLLGMGVSSGTDDNKHSVNSSPDDFSSSQGNDDDVSEWSVDQHQPEQQQHQFYNHIRYGSRDDIYFEDSATEQRQMDTTTAEDSFTKSKKYPSCHEPLILSQDDSSTVHGDSQQKNNNVRQRNHHSKRRSNGRNQYHNDDHSSQNEQTTTTKNRGGKNTTLHNKKKNNSSRSSSYEYQICLFIQMELCRPDTLADWIRERNIICSCSSISRNNDIINHHHPHMDRHPHHSYNIHMISNIFQQIVAGLKHVHERGIIHRDLKPANIFAAVHHPHKHHHHHRHHHHGSTANTKDDSTTSEMRGEGTLQFKLGDFGLSKLHNPNNNSSPNSPKKVDTLQLRNKSRSSYNHYQTQRSPFTWDDPLTAGVGTASYAAPEQVGTTEYGTSADIFSLGLILLELLCSFTTEHERLQTFYDCRYKQQVPSSLNKYPVAVETILTCTSPLPDQRPTAADLLGIDISANTISGSIDINQQNESKTSSREQVPSPTSLENIRQESNASMDREQLKRQHTDLLTGKDDEIKSLKLQLQEKDHMISQLQTALNKLQCNYNELKHLSVGINRTETIDPLSNNSNTSHEYQNNDVQLHSNPHHFMHSTVGLSRLHINIHDNDSTQIIEAPSSGSSYSSSDTGL